MLENIPLTNKSLILGVGNTLKMDDGAGPGLISLLKDKIILKTIDTGVAPENYIGKISKLSPDVILIADAVDYGAQPGEIKLFNPSELANETFSTHGISLKTFVDFLRSESSAKIFLLGIQPGRFGFGTALSPAVQKALKRVSTELLKIFSSPNA